MGELLLAARLMTVTPCMVSTPRLFPHWENAAHLARGLVFSTSSIHKKNLLAIAILKIPQHVVASFKPHLIILFD
jgi:hypothetical protein